MSVSAIVPAPFRNCVVKIIGMPPVLQKKKIEKNHPHKNTRIVPNRNGWLQETIKGKFLNKHIRNKYQNTLQASQAEPLPPSKMYVITMHIVTNSQSKFLKANSTSAKIPTPIVKINIKKKNKFPGF